MLLTPMDTAQLVSLGAPINLGNHDSRTAVHVAAAEGLLEAVKFLVTQCGADPNPRDRWGCTPLDDAHKGGNDSVAEFLLSCGGISSQASANSSNRELCEASQRGDVDAVNKLLPSSVDINWRNCDQRTAVRTIPPGSCRDPSFECLTSKLPPPLFL